MRLLLTSNGLMNESISTALFNLVGKPADEISLAFMPTAMNMVGGDKEWFISDLRHLQDESIGFIDIVDISAVPQDVWLPRLEAVDVLYFSGGHAPHLLQSMHATGFMEVLPHLLTKCVYAGMSAGAVVAAPTLSMSNAEKKQRYADQFGYGDNKALGLVDFYFRPHLNAPNFPEVTEEHVREAARGITKRVYVVDDETAVRVDGNDVTVISEGEYFIIDP